ncbi:MAG TPA: helix-turn-helix domain-containing protein [Gemmataceae bacterium]|nr:helix-turn-helix domain-containing protein [Gemmataceae bacterium]
MTTRTDPRADAGRPAEAESSNGASPPGRGPAAALEPLLVDLAGVARLLSLSRRTLKRMVAAGELPGVVRQHRRVLVRYAALKKWVDDGCPPVGPTSGRRRAVGGRRPGAD